MLKLRHRLLFDREGEGSHAAARREGRNMGFDLMGIMAMVAHPMNLLFLPTSVFTSVSFDTTRELR